MGSSLFHSSMEQTFYFPFRLILRLVRKLEESIVRSELSYTAENLLLRGGYRKTHFQADQTTFQSVSQMGEIFQDTIEKFTVSYETFIPKFSKEEDIKKGIFKLVNFTKYCETIPIHTSKFEGNLEANVQEVF